MYKQVIVIRNDLKLSKGKLSVQVAHASLDSYKKTDKKIIKEWEKQGAKKVVVKVKDLDKLLEIHKKVEKLGLPCSLIRDAGKTQVKSGTITVLGVGPCESKDVDKITRSLKLL